MIRYTLSTARSPLRELRQSSPHQLLSHSTKKEGSSRYFYFDGSNGNNKNGYNSESLFSSSSQSSSPSSSSQSLTKLGSGDAAPRYPHVLALPVVSRPIFPLIPVSLTLRDAATIAAVEELSKQSGYVSVFLRKTHSTGVTESGVILDKPEIITDASDLYKVGTFCQVHRFTRAFDSTSTGAGGAASATGDKNEQHNDENHDHNNNDADVSPVSLWLMGHRRVNLTSIDNIGPPIDATVSHWNRLEYTGTNSNSDTLRALSNEALSVIREVAQMNALFRESLTWFPGRIDANDPFKLADFCASVSKSASPEELQAVLEDADPEMRLHKALVLLNKEKEVAKLQQEISSKVEEKMTDQQRKYFLNEQLKSIKKELGMEQDDKEALIEKYRKQLASCQDIPIEVQEVIDSELEKLSTLEKNSSEFNVTRSYLDWLCSVPWGKTSDENYDLVGARKILDRDHYGLQDVKDTILQFIAVGKLKGSVQGKILCLAGPPGVGKTSVAQSIAHTLGREFYRFSVGGLSDVSEIKGHRRTYVGAMPGKIVQCLKSTFTMNPVVLMDEIDKLGSGYRGDPASALLEVLDPSQNSSFRDYFMDVPIDISKVLFMCTANDLDRIPGPLLDRMEIIRLSGYDFPEKVAIAEKYLVPKSMAESGLMMKRETEEESKDKKSKDEEGDKVMTEKKSEETGNKDEKVDDQEDDLSPLARYVHAENIPDSLAIESSAVESLVRWYAREAGVRNLAKLIDKITRKLALQVVAEEENAELNEKSSRKSDSWRVTEENLSDYVGKPIFTSDRMYEKDPLPHGIVMGLAYTSMGGSALYIETQGIRRGSDDDGKRRGGGNLKVTGQLGDVMKESATIAYTVARAQLPESKYFDENDIHMHVPEGATPKDGPSAGITMVTSMISLAMDTPVRADVAMTGEVSLTGKVLPVGGIKEKTMAARRAGITCLILPAANKRDWDEIAPYLKEGVDIHFAEDYSTVREVAFGGQI